MCTVSGLSSEQGTGRSVSFNVFKVPFPTRERDHLFIICYYVQDIQEILSEWLDENYSVCCIEDVWKSSSPDSLSLYLIPLQWPVYGLLHSMFYLRVCRVLFSNKRPAQLSTISFRKSRHLRRINVCLHATCLCLPEINMRLHAVYICLHASARNACLFTFAWVRQTCQCLQLRGCKHCADYSSDLRYWNISNKVEF